MKLKNKKTGEIGYPYFQNWKEITCVIVDENAKPIAEYTSLAELNEEWEDAPEKQKEYWSINELGSIVHIAHSRENTFDRARKEFGNYFETEEEAEKAVEKLKSWKRLKDKGFRLSAVVDGFFCLDIYIAGDRYKELKDDLMVVFGGEE